MKKKMFYYLRSKAFQTYLYSYVGILIFVFLMLSMISIWHIAENVRAENIRVTRNKLYTILEDMEMQIESMREMVMEIATLPEFKWDYLQESKYYEIEMLDRLEGYQNNNSIFESYFLKYGASDTVYMSQGKTRPFSLYYQTEIGEEGFEEVAELFERLCEKADASYVFQKHGDVMLLLYPLKTYATSKIGREGVLCFLISRESLEKRIEQLVQLSDGELTLCYKDFCMMGEDDSCMENKAEGIELKSLKGNFRISFCPDESSNFLWSNVLSEKEVFALWGTFLLLFVLGFAVAYWNYRPIQKIADKYRDPAEVALEAEWESIDALIASLLQGKERSNELLQKQYQVIRDQIIQLIVSGGYSEQVMEHMMLFNIRLEAAIYGVIQCTIDDGKEMKLHRDWIHKAVEDLSGDGMTLYSCWDGNSSLQVLAAVEDENQLAEVEELLQALFETRKLIVCTSVRDVCRDLKQLGRKQEESGEIESVVQKAADKEEEFPEKNSTANLVVEYIRANCTQYDLSLELIAREFGITSTYLCRIVKQEAGKSYKEFLTELRMAEAKRLLQDKNISVVEVCQQTGYLNVSHFIKIFQKYEGVTPAKYRDRA